MKIKIACLAILISLSLSDIINGQTKTSSFDKAWLKAIVSIEIFNNGKYYPIGTGFLVSTPQKHVALVTTKHVVLDDRNKVIPNLVYRLNELKGRSNVFEANYPPKYTDSSGWFFSKEYDLACRIIQFSESSDIMPIDSSDCLASKYLEPGANVLVLGFPLGLRSEEYSRPLVRRGIIAKADLTEIIIDSFVFPGNSGGPVLYVPPLKLGVGLKSELINEEKFIGIVSSYIPYNDVAISNQTKRPRITFEENSGLCSAVPIDALINLLYSKEFQSIDQNLYKYR
jgi:hypothetical protein